MNQQQQQHQQKNSHGFPRTFFDRLKQTACALEGAIETLVDISQIHGTYFEVTALEVIGVLCFRNSYCCFVVSTHPKLMDM
jgi:hypothetical protein